MRIDSDNVRNTTIIEVKRDDNSEWNFCLEYEKPIDYTTHTYISSGGVHSNRRAITLNSIKFYDNEDEVYEGENEDQKARVNTEAYRSFEGTATDLLHLGNIDGVFLMDAKKGIDAYNDKLLKYNSKYAQLIGK